MRKTLKTEVTFKYQIHTYKISASSNLAKPAHKLHIACCCLPQLCRLFLMSFQVTDSYVLYSGINMKHIRQLIGQIHHSLSCQWFIIKFSNWKLMAAHLERCFQTFDYNLFLSKCEAKSRPCSSRVMPHCVSTLSS